eukprot:COSAG06_NODE_2517_length_6730_cov_5.273413_1_plen_59_part_10
MIPAVLSRGIELGLLRRRHHPHLVLAVAIAGRTVAEVVGDLERLQRRDVALRPLLYALF